MMRIRLNLLSALTVLVLSLALSSAAGVAQDPSTKNQSGARPQNTPKDPANNGSNNSGGKYGSQGYGFSGQPVSGALPPSTPQNSMSQSFPPPIQNGFQNGFYGSTVPGYPPPMPYTPSMTYPGSMPQQELMVYQDGEFKVIQNTNEPHQLVEAREAFKVLSDAVQALRSESSKDSERADAKKTLTQYLRAHFEHDEKKRREQVESLEAQVIKLKAQLEKRAQSKEQLIELRLKLLENDANGLAFPQSWSMMPGMEPSGQLQFGSGKMPLDKLPAYKTWDGYSNPEFSADFSRPNPNLYPNPAAR